MNLLRVRALMQRYFIMYSRSSFRVLDVIFWPLMDLFIWGFTAVYLSRLQHSAPLLGFLIGAVIFWDILFRCQQAVTVTFLEDVWSGNLMHFFAAPIRISEFIAATYAMGLMQSLIILLGTGVIAYSMYSFDLLVLGWQLVPFFVNLLMMGWSLGTITTAMIMRWGQRAEVLAWAFASLLQPISAVFYPVNVLPEWIRPLSLCLPSTHVFEGMRAILSGGTFQRESLITAVLLNVVYMIGAGLFFRHMFNEARKQGLIGRLGT